MIRKWLKYALILALVAGGAWLVFTVLSLASENDQLEGVDRLSIADRAELREAINEDRTKINLLVEQIEGLGEEPVVNPSTPLPRILRIPGDDGDDGKDGKDGADGEDGRDSTVPGPQGPGATDEQVAAQVAAYCSARNDCTPPTPKDGTNGKDGEPGRGIASIGCTSGLTPQTYTVVYTDGTTQDFTCGELPPIEPTPTPE
jgi:hypothetical protein